jgi:hypothetical protein
MQIDEDTYRMSIFVTKMANKMVEYKAIIENILAGKASRLTYCLKSHLKK